MKPSLQSCLLDKRYREWFTTLDASTREAYQKMKDEYVLSPHDVWWNMNFQIMRPIWILLRILRFGEGTKPRISKQVHNMMKLENIIDEYKNSETEWKAYY